MKHSYPIASFAPTGWTVTHLPGVYVDETPWLLSIRGLDYHGDIRPAREAAAGFVTFQSRADSGLCLSLADACGRAHASKPIAERAESLLQALSAYEPQRPEAAVEAVNRAVCDVAENEAYLTLFHAWVDPNRRELRYVNAGHEPALLVRARCERVVALEHTGTAIGLTSRTAYGQRSVELEPGDALVAFTAGVAEAANLHGGMFGSRGVLQAVLEMRNAGAATVTTHVLDEAERHAGWAVRGADHGVAVVRFVGERERPVLTEAKSEEKEHAMTLAAA